MRRVCVVSIIAIGLSACAGRAPAPVQIVQPQDRFMDCNAIFAEVQANNAKVQQLASDQGLKTAQNVAAGVAGFVVPVLWFGMDFQGTADKETTALQSRQQYLATLAEQRRCGEAAPPPAPPPQAARPTKSNSRQPVARSAAPPPVATAAPAVVQAGPPEPQLSEADRAMSQRN
jgi:hypothetical protein